MLYAVLEKVDYTPEVLGLYRSKEEAEKNMPCNGEDVSYSIVEGDDSKCEGQTDCWLLIKEDGLDNFSEMFVFPHEMDRDLDFIVRVNDLHETDFGDFFEADEYHSEQGDEEEIWFWNKRAKIKE